MLAQAVVAQNRVKHDSAFVKPIVQFCLDNNINIFQMPCPELMCAEGGLGRQAHGKTWYEQHGLRQKCEVIAKEQAEYILKLQQGGLDILGIIGVEYSPACSPNYLNRGPVTIKEKGIYIEELQREIAERGLKIRFVGLNERWPRKLKKDLDALIE